jgi:ornithine carbamoyltransferase
MKHFIDITDYSSSDIKDMLKLAIEIKRTPFQDRLKNKTLGLIFEKPSMRTRVSFEVGMMQLGGQVVSLQANEIGLGKREAVKDISRVMSRYVDIIMIRTFAHDILKEFKSHATIPVINGLSDASHPCQAMADALTVIEHFNRWDNIHLVYVGDGNNVCISLIEICHILGWSMTVSTPEGYEPESKFPFNFVRDAHEAVSTADVIYTDVWTSMGQEEETKQRLKDFAPYQINAALMASAKSDTVFMHCLPAHRDEEVTNDVMESSQSIVFDQAENRLHAQKGILAYLLQD